MRLKIFRAVSPVGGGTSVLAIAIIYDSLCMSVAISVWQLILFPTCLCEDNVWIYGAR